MLVYCFFQVLVLSMGGRLYFMSNLLSVLAFLSLRYGIRVRPVKLASAAKSDPRKL